MKKRTIYELDIEDESPRDYSVAMLMFHNVAPNYAFVDDLNHLYNLQLGRINDMPLDGANWPIFTYHDSLFKLSYYLIERPLGHETPISTWTAGHKLLIVIGDRAGSVVEAIHNEFCSATSTADPTDLLAAEHANLLADMLGSFTTTTIIDTSAPAPAGISKKAQREYDALCNLIDEILDYIDVENICY